MRFSQDEKMEIIRIVEQSELGVNRTLQELGIHKSTFYLWYNRYLEKGYDGLAPKPRAAQTVWNRIPDEIRGKVIDHALDHPELSSRELAFHYVDNQGYYISESSVYRILKAAGLITTPAFATDAAADRFKDPTTRVNELWQTDFTYLKVVGWGWYYLSTVLDDFSRYIVAWKLCPTMKAVDAEQTLRQALKHAQCPEDNPPKVLSDNGPCYVGQELKGFFDGQGIQHVRGRPNHPQTQGKIERYHRSMKNIVRLEHYYFPWELENRIAEFVDYYNNRRYHESLNNLTPADVFFGRGEKILRKRALTKAKTLNQRKKLYFKLKTKSVS